MWRHADDVEIDALVIPAWPDCCAGVADLRRDDAFLTTTTYPRCGYFLGARHWLDSLSGFAALSDVWHTQAGACRKTAVR